MQGKADCPGEHQPLKYDLKCALLQHAAESKQLTKLTNVSFPEDKYQRVCVVCFKHSGDSVNKNALGNPAEGPPLFLPHFTLAFFHI